MGKIIYNDKVYTSYYDVINKYVKPDRTVAISVSTMRGFKGISFKELNPPWEIVEAYKNGTITKEQYTKIYYDEVLSKLSALDVYNTLKGKVMCCWEKKGHFCHRHIVLKWLENRLGDGVIGGEL